MWARVGGGGLQFIVNYSVNALWQSDMHIHIKRDIDIDLSVSVSVSGSECLWNIFGLAAKTANCH